MLNLHTVYTNSLKKLYQNPSQLSKLLCMLCCDLSLSVYGSVGWVRAMASGNAEAASRLMLASVRPGD